jgi:hypothetical protein
MHILTYFAAVGSVLFGLLFVADAMLPERAPLAISSEFHGVSATLHGSSTGSFRTPAEPDLPGLAPAPDMKSIGVKLAREGAPAATPKAVGLNLEPVNQPVAEPTAPKKHKQVVRARKAPEHVARSAGWRDQYAQANDHGWNWGSNNRSAWRNNGWRNDPRQNEWRNDFWRNDYGWR